VPPPEVHTPPPSRLGSVLVAIGPRLREEVCAQLGHAGYAVRRPREPEPPAGLLRDSRCDAVLCDLSTEGPGAGFFREVRVAWDDVPVIVSAQAGHHGEVIAALREGAFGYLEEPFAPPDIVLLVGRAVSHRRLVAQHSAFEARWRRLETAVRHMNEAGSRDDLLAVLRRELPPLLGVDNCSIYECADGSLTLAMSTREAATSPAIDISDGRPVLVPGTSGAEPPSLLVPAFVQFQPVAVLALERRSSRTSEHDLQFFQAVAAHVGSALRVRQRTEALEQALRDLRDAQEELLRTERVAVVGKLAFDVSHEMKNRLTSMTFAVQNVRDAIAAGAQTGMDSTLDLLTEDIRRMRERVEAFYAMARHRGTHTSVCRIDRLVEQVLERLQYDPRRVGLTCHAEPASSRVDEEQLYSAIANLVINAFEALEHTANAQINVTVAARDQRVRITVEDNGPGVPPEIRGKIFDAFYGTKPKGTGLGLSQVFVFAEVSGGRVYLADTSVGARFVLEVPEASP
jgi:signal transduction histidine kinase